MNRDQRSEQTRSNADPLGVVQGRRDYYPGVFGLTAGGSQDPIRKSTSDGVHSRNLHQQLNDVVMRWLVGHINELM